MTQITPTDITIDREAAELTIRWSDETGSKYPLRWLRANCPCATCKELRREVALQSNTLTLNTGPMVEPSTEIAEAELVGSYAIRFTWADGHNTGIYGFNSLRASADSERFPDGLTDFVFE